MKKRLAVRLSFPSFLFPFLVMGCGFTGTTSGASPPRLPFLFSDHMVLQRDQPVSIWGWAAQDRPVTALLGGESGTAVPDSSGRWALALPPFQAGGPYELVVRSGEAVTLRDVWVGEVWLVSGQSNMGFPLRLSKGGLQETRSARLPFLRLFSVEIQGPNPPATGPTGTWKICSPDSAGDFPAVAYYFAKELHRSLGVPIGLISACRGSTPAEAWTPREALAQIPQWRPLLEKLAREPTGEKKDFELRLSNLRLVPQDPRKQPGHVVFEGGLDDQHWGGLWLHSESAGTLGSLAMEGSPAGQGISLLYSGSLAPGGWAACYTRLIPGNGFLDLRPYAYLEFDEKSRGLFSLSVGPLEKSRGEFYDSEIICPSSQWRTEKIPVEKLRPEGLNLPGAPPEGIQDLSFSVHAPADFLLPGGLYDALVAPLAAYPIRGIVWYQGESNVSRASQYGPLLFQLIQGWRKAWARPDLPFIVVQLPGYGGISSEPTESHWAELREAQRETAAETKAGLVTTMDLQEGGEMHPTDKAPVGVRTARTALGWVYHRLKVYSGPSLESAVPRDGRVFLRFNVQGGSLETKGGGALRGFALAGADRRFHWAFGKIAGPRKVELSSAVVPHPRWIRYAWADHPTGNLMNREGFPVPPFQWEISAEGQQP